MRNSSSEFPFKVVHFSTSHVGGAAIAARRLHLALLQLGIDSVFVTLDKGKAPLGPAEVALKRVSLLRVIGGVFTKLQLLISRKSLFTIFSLATVRSKRILGLITSPNTIVHIHNSYNFITPRIVKSIAAMGIPVIYTAHDQRLMTGGCHYSFSCTNFESGCKKCPELPIFINHIPQFNLRLTMASYNSDQNKISVIAPSKWLFEEFLKSEVGESLDLHFIPNVSENSQTENLVDLKRFRNPGREFVIGLAAMDSASYIKGGDRVDALIEDCKSDETISFLYLSEVLQNGGTHEDFWGAVNVLLVLSRADNSPNVIHEAKNRLIPVIGSKVGGITELLLPGVDYLVDKDSENISILRQAIQFIRSNPNSRRGNQAIGDHWRSYLGGPLLAHVSLYQQLISTSEKMP
jgi:glycosyltransferase involved in cell wall biosynthesis